MMKNTRPTRSAAVVALATISATVLALGSAAAVQRQTIRPAAAVRPAGTQPAHASSADVMAMALHRSRPAPARGRTVRPLPAARGHHTAAADRRPHPAAERPHSARRPAHHRRGHRILGPTGWYALDRAIRRIPTYRPGAAIWRVSNRYGHWGTADWYHATLYISPSVPDGDVYDVAVHEWSHELSVLDYGGDVDSAVAAMNSAFGGSGLTGPERAADCMAILQGATYTHYTTCHDRAWRQAAARLVAGERL